MRLDRLKMNFKSDIIKFSYQNLLSNRKGKSPNDVAEIARI